MLDVVQTQNIELRQRQEEKCILIVDDEAIIRDLCHRALKGYRVLEAVDGEEALKVFENGGVDVILTDVMMPNMDGIELLKRLKEREPTLVVIVMTGYADKDIILNALKADADDFITKPLNLLQLKTAIEKALVKKALKEEIANLKNVDRLKSNFLSLVSHKFRTPITSISLFLQNLASGIYDPEDPEYREHLGMIYKESCYLGGLVTDLLNFSQMMDKGDQLNLEPCNLNSIILDILPASREVAGKNGVEIAFNLDPIPSLFLDREKVSFALKQVIDNAFKFSKDKGKVSIVIERQEEFCRIIVEDQGIGISKEDLPKIFEKFYQVDRENTGQIRGFGLGLFYAREFIRRHHGKLVIESEPGDGTRVTITLPAAEGCPI
ncbi:hybrid sensor histidine kinase/response regulator [Geotalea sp. SG265]|uniref:hybrid sensor histidine kinase/response regulator n=1 Tax=Geotalea sp. SG265 TaxID=2922867 RepID=UPI001FAEA547|nr:hybrid sensor histidine kinase/response regulator [Geotalea sp. SG265]